jgi:hypothetical protein
MAITLSQLMANPGTISVGGREFTLSPLRLIDVSKMQTWYCDLPLLRLKEQFEKFGSIYDDETRRKMLEEAQADYKTRHDVMAGMLPDAKEVERIKQDMNREISSIDGVAKLLYMSIKKNHPEVTEDEMAGVVDIESLSLISDMLDSITFSKKDDAFDLLDEPEGEEKKTPDGEN